MAGKRIYGAAAVIAAVGIAATAGVMPARAASDARPPVTVHSLMRAIVQGESMGIDGRTYWAWRVIRYTARQPKCSRADAGQFAIVTGDGAWPFVVRCEPDGPVYVWDAQR